MHLDGLEIGEQDMAVLDGGLLLAEEELAGAQPQRLLAAVKDIAQDDVRELVDEHRRHVDAALEEVRVARLDRARRKKTVAEPEDGAVVVPGVLVLDGIYFFVRNRSTRGVHQRAMKRDLCIAG